MQTLSPNPFTARVYVVFEDTALDGQLKKLKVSEAAKKNFLLKAQRLGFKAKEYTHCMAEHETNENLVLLGMGKRERYKGHTGPAFLRHGVVQFMVRAKQQGFTRIIWENVEELGLSEYTLGFNLELGYRLGNYEFYKYKGTQAESVKTIAEYGFKKEESAECKQGREEAVRIYKGIALTRDLVNEPANVVHPVHLANLAGEIAYKSQGKITCKVLGRKECGELGMGAYLAVAKGSQEEPQFIILTYEPKNSKSKVAVVGKSITFDSGGLSIKPAKAMEDMKIDMAGGATTLGLFAYLSEYVNSVGDLPYTVVGILPACENMISGSAMRPGDIVQALNGTTIEILNTDAEGRLALADALSYACKHEHADVLIDLATLTGAAMVALGTEYSALMSNNTVFANAFLEKAHEHDEKVWPLPLPKRYRNLMLSKQAVLKNVSAQPYGGAITAGIFLEEFVDGKAWIHLDIAPIAYNEGEPFDDYIYGATGWGVLSLASFLKSDIHKLPFHKGWERH